MLFRSGPTFHFRELTPKDFYLAQILRQTEQTQVDLVLRLLLDHKVLEEATSSQTKAVLKWVVETLLDKTVLTVENWLEIAYHLCKQRWDNSIDWLEQQPMSKVNLMIDIVQKHNEEQEKQMKKSARRR